MKNLLFTLVLGLGLVQMVSAQEDLICKNSPTGSKITFLDQTGKTIKLSVKWDEGAGFNGRINLNIENGVCTDCPQLGGIDGRFPRSATYEIEQTNPSEPVIIRWASPAPKGYCGDGSMTIGGSTTITSTITSARTGRIWMDRNLGATQVATSSTDAAAYGDLYQWGRGDDGHQLRTSATTNELSSTDQPGHGNFILAPTSPYDWRSSQNPNLWQGVGGVNNPCPEGFRLPTGPEWDAERINSAADAFDRFKLPLAGYREYRSGSLSRVGNEGFYWSSRVSGIYSHARGIVNNSAFGNSSSRSLGRSVRCIKN